MNDLNDNILDKIEKSLGYLETIKKFPIYYSKISYVAQGLAKQRPEVFKSILINVYLNYVMNLSSKEYAYFFQSKHVLCYFTHLFTFVDSGFLDLNDQTRNVYFLLIEKMIACVHVEILQIIDSLNKNGSYHTKGIMIIPDNFDDMIDKIYHQSIKQIMETIGVIPNVSESQRALLLHKVYLSRTLLNV